MNGDDWERLARYKTRRAVAAERRRWLVWALRIVAALAITAVVAWALKQL